MEYSIKIRKIHDAEAVEAVKNPVDSLDLLEKLRKEAGKFIYGYPAPFRRVVNVVRKGER